MEKIVFSKKEMEELSKEELIDNLLKAIELINMQNQALELADKMHNIAKMSMRL